jgi:hypothetical protein
MQSDVLNPPSVRPPRLAGLAIALIVSALVPALVAVALLVSAALRRPLLARYLRPSARAAAAPLTIAWGVALLAIAAVQVTGAIVGLGSITTPGGLAARTGVALAAELIVLAASAGYLARLHPRSGVGRAAC